MMGIMNQGIVGGQPEASKPGTGDVVSKTGWKQVEREAAALIGARRCWSNAGGREDADSAWFAQQVKNPARMSLAEVERLVEEMTVRGIDAGKIPMVVLKRAARRPTQMLVVLPAEAWALVWSMVPPRLTTFPQTVRTYLRELPGMRKRVAAYVAASKARGRRTERRAT